MAKIIEFPCPVCGKNLTASSKEEVTRCVQFDKLLHLFYTLDPIGDVHMAHHHYSSGYIAVLAAKRYAESIRLILYPPLPPMSLVEQIDKILQKNISGTPLEKRYIRLFEDPSAGVIVKVDHVNFMGVDAVTDPEVKAAIKAAIKQWEDEQ